MEHQNGWNQEHMLRKRLDMYRRFNKQNPQVVGVFPLLGIIAVLEIIYYLSQIIIYFIQIDNIIFKIYKSKQAGFGNSEVIFDDDLLEYIQESIQ